MPGFRRMALFLRRNPFGDQEGDGRDGDGLGEEDRFRGQRAGGLDKDDGLTVDKRVQEDGGGTCDTTEI